MKPSTYSKIAEAVRLSDISLKTNWLYKPDIIHRLADILAESDKKLDKTRFIEECNK